MAFYERHMAARTIERQKKNSPKTCALPQRLFFCQARCGATRNVRHGFRPGRLNVGGPSGVQLQEIVQAKMIRSAMHRSMQIDEFDREVYKAIAAGLSIAAVVLVALYLLAQLIYPSPAPNDNDRCPARNQVCADLEPARPHPN